MSIVYQTYPRTAPPAAFVEPTVEVFRQQEDQISTHAEATGLSSDAVLSRVRPGLISLGFEVEAGKKKEQKIQRPVFFGENGVPSLQYEIDAYHPEWRCGLEVEAGRAWKSNAVYRDLVQAMVMSQVDTLIIAVARSYRYGDGHASRDYENTCKIAEVLYGNSRFRLPYGLVVIGY